MKNAWTVRITGILVAGALTLPGLIAPRPASANGTGVAIGAGAAVIGTALFARHHRHHRHHRKDSKETTPAPNQDEQSDTVNPTALH